MHDQNQVMQKLFNCKSSYIKMENIITGICRTQICLKHREYFADICTITNIEEGVVYEKNF